MEKINYVLHKLHPDAENGVFFIKKFMKKNKINLYPFTVAFDFDCDELGYYLDIEGSRTIYYNPLVCEFITEESEHSPGFLRDYSHFGTLVHEFIHMMFDIHSKGKIIEDYTKKFPSDRIWFHHHMSANIEEEMVGLFMIYATNPLLLKLLNKDRYLFFKKYYLPAYPCSNKHFIKVYNEWPYKCKKEIHEKCGIAVDLSENKVYKI